MKGPVLPSMTLPEAFNALNRELETLTAELAETKRQASDAWRLAERAVLIAALSFGSVLLMVIKVASTLGGIQ